MKTITKLVLICLLLNLLCISKVDAQSFCSDIPIDDFASSTLIDIRADGTNPIVQDVDDGGSGVIGRFRSIRLERLEGVTPSSESRILIETESLSVSNDNGNRSRASIAYNANGAGLGLDLSSRELLRLSILRLDLGFDFTYILTDEAANEASLTESLSAITSATEVGFLFENFTGIQNVDLSSIDSIELIIESTMESADVRFEAFDFGCTTSIPESVAVPTMSASGYIAMAMLLLALGMFMFWTKRIRAKV